MNDMINDDAWIAAREAQVEEMWSTALPEADGEIPEDDLPY